MAKVKGQSMVGFQLELWKFLAYWSNNECDWSLDFIVCGRVE